MTLLNVDKALSLILETITKLGTETIQLMDAGERILAIDVKSDIDLPPFDNSAVDGFAIQYNDVTNASQDSPISLQNIADIPAGNNQDHRIESGKIARIMTGAPVPQGANAVVMVEDTDASWDENTDIPHPVNIYKPAIEGANIRKRGENIQAGDVILKAGHKIGASEMGMLAALGIGQVTVIKRPKVVIMSSGDELVGVDEPLGNGQIRDVNSYTLSQLVRDMGGIPIILPIAKDTKDSIRAMFESALNHTPDLMISSAGVSVGAVDYVRVILEEMGNIGFWKINLRPGKPLAFGTVKGIPFFGLPGNPVSAMVTFEVLVRPTLLKMSQRNDDSLYMDVLVGEDLRSDGRRTYARVKISQEGDNLIATQTGTQSSGALMSMVLADALLIIPEGMTNIEKGTSLKAKILRPLPQHDTK